MNVLGPYRNNCNRLFVRVGENGKYKTISYPKYLMEQSLGCPLAPAEDVHHIDGNPENNDLNNLQIKSHGEHQRAHSLKYPLEIHSTCAHCGKDFILSRDQRLKHNKGCFSEFYCSKRCSGYAGKQSKFTGM